MSILLRRGDTFHRWNGYRLFGGPPVLAPPSWALAERVWWAAGILPQPPRLAPEQLDAVEAAVRPRGRADRVCLVVPDATRVGPWKRLLGPLMKMLESAGRECTLLVATGTHACVSSGELARHLFDSDAIPETAARWTILQNGEDGCAGHRSVGTTPRGTPVRLHPRYLDADHRVCLGGVSFHYFAGFGGGPKLVFPGLGTPEAIAQNHRRALRGADAGVTGADAGAEWEAACRSGRLAGNPVAEDLRDAASLAPPHCEVVVVEEPGTRPDFARPAPVPLLVHAGEFPETHAGAVASFAQPRRLAFTQAPDLLITDAGGTPRDDSFLQAHKSLQHGVRFLPRGGALLLVARCGEWGSAQIETMSRGTAAAVPSGEGRGGLHEQTLAALRWAVRNRRVALWSDLPPDGLRALGVEALPTEAAAQAWCREVAPGYWGWLPAAERFLPQSGWQAGGLTGEVEP